MGWQPCQIKELAEELADSLANIGFLDERRLHWPLSTTISYPSASIGGIVALPNAVLHADSKVSIGYPIASVVDVSIRIESYRHRLRSVTECPRLTKFT